MAMKPEVFRGHVMDGPPGRYPPPTSLEYRIYLFNKRLQEGSAELDNQWWDELITEFFEDNATLSLSVLLEEGFKQFHIGRTLIPRFFRSFFAGGVTEIYFVIRHSKEMLNHATHCITLDCANASMMTHYPKPLPTSVSTDGHIMIEFSYDQFTRIRSWNFEVHGFVELIVRQAMMQEPHILEKISGNITKRGINDQTLKYLRLCEVLEPMREIMSRQKTCNIDPRDCLRNCLFQKWQRMMNPPEPIRGTKRAARKRKTSSTNQSNQIAASKKKSFPSSDVMVVGEPSLMGGGFGDEDERMITRLENQYDSAGGGVKLENSDLSNPGPHFAQTTSPAVRPNSNTMSPWQQGQMPTSQPPTSQQRPPSQAGASGPMVPNAHPPVSGPGSQTPSVPDNTGQDVMPSTPISTQN